MMKNYFMRGMLLLGAAALVGGSAMAQEKGAWRNINYKVTNISRADGWSGVIHASSDNVGEWFPGAGLVYQVIPDMPAGVYTLTLHGFNRPLDAPNAYQLYRMGVDASKAYAFINNTEVKMPNLFDNPDVTTDNLLGPDGYIWGVVPNGLGEARAAFDKGYYETTVLCEHPGGDLVFGVKNYGYVEGGLGNGSDEWTTFADFKLVDPDGKTVEIANPTFVMSGDDGWNIDNIAGAAKGRGDHNGSVFSKTNASPYNFGQTLYDMPAGKYRFVITAFNRNFLGNTPGQYVPFKGQYKIFEGESALDLYVSGADIPRGQVSGNDETYTPSGYVSPKVVEAYVYMNEGEKDCGWLEDDLNPWLEDGVVNGKETAIMQLFDEKMDEYPMAEQLPDKDGFYQFYDPNNPTEPMWWESGTEVFAASCFVNNPSLFQNVVEMEFTAAKNTFTIGTRKDFNQNNYWQPSFNWRLEYWDPEYTDLVNWGGTNSVADVVEDVEAPVEYYNLQGIRVAQPENGLYIVKEGKKVSKKVF